MWPCGGLKRDPSLCPPTFPIPGWSYAGCRWRVCLWRLWRRPGCSPCLWRRWSVCKGVCGAHRGAAWTFARWTFALIRRCTEALWRREWSKSEGTCCFKGESILRVYFRCGAESEITTVHFFRYNRTFNSFSKLSSKETFQMHLKNNTVKRTRKQNSRQQCWCTIWWTGSDFRHNYECYFTCAKHKEIKCFTSVFRKVGCQMRLCDFLL